MKRIILVMLGTIILSACSSPQKAKEATANSIESTANLVAQNKINQENLDKMTVDWPEASRKAIKATSEKYGLPNEASASEVIWHKNGPWKRTIVYKEEVTHLFPKKHTDVIEQVVDYKVPVDKFDDLAAFDGSVIVERTKGEMSARCDKEEMNYLALNLADEIVRGKKNVEDARREYGKSAMAFMMGKKNNYTDNLNFQPMRLAADPDHSIMKDMMSGSSTTGGTQE